MSHLSGWLAAVLLFVLWPVSAPAQPADPKTAFLDALGEFSLALDGARGDEGPRLQAALDRMDRALSGWDAMIAGFERAMSAQIGGADAPLAARMRSALGVAYLDRARVRDALAQFTMASTLDRSNKDAARLQALVHSQLLDDENRAIEALRAAAALDSKDLATVYALARVVHRAGREDEATAALEAVLAALDATTPTAPRAGGVTPFIRLGLVPEVAAVEPFLPPVRYAEGYAALRLGDLRAAVEQFRRALATDPLSATPATPGSFRARAAAAFRDGRVEEARKTLAAGIAETPQDAEARRILGLVEVADGRYAEGIRALEAAIERDPGEERTRLALADALVQNAQPGAALAVLEQALTAMPRSGRARYALGLLHRQQGRYIEALPELEQVLTHEPLIAANSIYQTIGAVRRARLDLAGAIEAYAARAALTPNDARAHQDLGEVHALLGETVWAQMEFRIALLLEPERVPALTALAQAYQQDGRDREAAAAAQRAVALDVGNREARYLYATALMRLGDEDEGRRQLQAFERLQAEDAEVQARGLALGRLRREATVAAAAGDHAAAAALLERAIEYEPASAQAHVDLGLALLNAGRSADAIPRLSAAVPLGAPIDVHLHIANAYEAAGRADEARRARDTYASLKREAIRRGEAGR